MRVIRITPRGYCHGVVGAMKIVQEAIADSSLPRPIYVVGMIVHNRHVVDAFTNEGVITLDGASRLELLDQAQRGTVIFTAHGVSPAARRKAARRGLRVLDATCPDVTRTHDLIRERTTAGYEVIYIGRKGHPEPEGAVGVAPSHVHLIETEADLDGLHLGQGPIAVTNQTTLSQWDTANLMAKVLAQFPEAEVYNEICMATQLRQQAVVEQAGEADLCIVVGDPRSNNSNRLVQVSEEIAKTPARLVQSFDQVDPAWLFGRSTVAVSSGASTPSVITKAVISYLEQFDELDPATWRPAETELGAGILARPHFSAAGSNELKSKSQTRGGIHVSEPLDLRLKRIYQSPASDDGCRILVDRLWPRGVRKSDAAVDLWLKDVAPSPELRKDFGHRPERFPHFREAYETQLEADIERSQDLKRLLTEVHKGTVTLLYAARDLEHNHAVVLRDFLLRHHPE